MKHTFDFVAEKLIQQGLISVNEYEHLVMLGKNITTVYSSCGMNQQELEQFLNKKVSQKEYKGFCEWCLQTGHYITEDMIRLYFSD